MWQGDENYKQAKALCDIFGTQAFQEATSFFAKETLFTAF